MKIKNPIPRSEIELRRRMIALEKALIDKKVITKEEIENKIGS